MVRSTQLPSIPPPMPAPYSPFFGCLQTNLSNIPFSIPPPKASSAAFSLTNRLQKNNYQNNCDNKKNNTYSANHIQSGRLLFFLFPGFLIGCGYSVFCFYTCLCQSGFHYSFCSTFCYRFCCIYCCGNCDRLGCLCPCSCFMALNGRKGSIAGNRFAITFRDTGNVITMERFGNIIQCQTGCNGTFCFQALKMTAGFCNAIRFLAISTEDNPIVAISILRYCYKLRIGSRLYILISRMLGKVRRLGNVSCGLRGCFCRLSGRLRRLHGGCTGRSCSGSCRFLDRTTWRWRRCCGNQVFRATNGSANTRSECGKHHSCHQYSNHSNTSK